MNDLTRAGYHPADTNGDGLVTDDERLMYLEFKRKELEDQDAQRDSMRKMAWFALFGMLLYPTTIMITSAFGLDKAASIIGDIAPTYFVAISALVAAFFGANAYSSSKKESSSLPPPKAFSTAPSQTVNTAQSPKPINASPGSKPKGPVEEEGELL